MLTDTATLGQSGLGSNGNEEVLHTQHSSRIGSPPSEVVECYIQNTLFWGRDHINRQGIQSAYSKSSRQDRKKRGSKEWGVEIRETGVNDEDSDIEKGSMPLHVFFVIVKHKETIEVLSVKLELTILE